MNKLTSVVVAIAALGLAAGQAAFADETTVESQSKETRDRVADPTNAQVREQIQVMAQVQVRSRTHQESPTSHYGIGYEARQTQPGPEFSFGDGPTYGPGYNRGTGSASRGGNDDNGGNGGNGGNGAT